MFEHSFFVVKNYGGPTIVCSPFLLFKIQDKPALQARVECRGEDHLRKKFENQLGDYEFFCVEQG